MSQDALGDRMKMYEKLDAQRFIPLMPVYARLDGIGFSKFTKGLDRPYDHNMALLMQDVTSYLVAETGAKIGYTQSDEISLVWYSNSINSQIFFDAKKQKMISVLAAMASVRFNKLLPNYLPSKTKEEPKFDCRVYQLPTLSEAANVILWRERDASKNSISMAASQYYSHKELDNKNGSDKQEMLFQKGVNWNDYPDFFKRGIFIQRRKVDTTLSAYDLANLPPKHHARQNTDLKVKRTVTSVIEMPPFNKVVNKIDVIFYGADPLIRHITD